jgi:DNA-directed RNA polymerase beta subunit
VNLESLEAYKLRKSFSKIPSVLEIPHLLEVQVKSYNGFQALKKERI